MCEAEKFLLICDGAGCNFQEEISQGDDIKCSFEKDGCPECGCCSFKVKELSGGALV